MSAQPLPRLTPAQYLEMERSSELRHEYLNGEVFDMSGGTFRHFQIIANLTRALGNRLEGGPCFAGSSELRVKVSSRNYTYPDVVVVCGEPKFVDNQLDTLINPTMLVEVLSPSTERDDRGPRSARYRTIESLREYVVVAQSEPRVEVLRLQADGNWLLVEFTGIDATCRFESVGCSIPLAEIYRNITFEPEAELPQ